MELFFRTVDGNHYVQNVRYNKEKRELKWDLRGASHYLIIIGKYGSSIDFDENTKAELGRIAPELINGRSFNINNNDLTVELITNSRYIQNGSAYSVQNRAAVYSVLCCALVSGDLYVYIPTNECGYIVNVPFGISISTSEKKTGLIGRSTGFYEVKIDDITGYVDGELKYRVNDGKQEFCVTKEMLAGMFYIKGLPTFESSNDGYIILQH